MKRTFRLTIAVLAASLVFVTGCYENDVAYPAVPGYDGLVAAGWEDFGNSDYVSAMENFQNAIEIDTSRPEAFLGAAWSAAVLPDYWGICYNYAYMASNLDDGDWAIQTKQGTLIQDTLWTNFECIFPELTANDLIVIASIGDSLLVIGGDTLCPFYPSNPEANDSVFAVNNYIVGEWFDDQYYDHGPDSVAIHFQYRFEIQDPNVSSIFSVFNEFSATDISVDSIVNGTTSSDIYLDVRRRNVSVPRYADFYTWIMFDNVINYEYVTYTSPGGATGIPIDAQAAYGILQDARAEAGDGIEGAGLLLGIASEGDYSFEHYSSITSTNLKGMAASIAYRNNAYRFALGICRSSGFGLDLDTLDPGFLILLAQTIEEMLL